MEKSTAELTLFLFRHGQTEWSMSGRHTGRSDIALTDAGRQQASLLKPLAEKIHFSSVLVSPLSRARETAALAGLGSQVELCPDLAELDYGEYEGLTITEIRQRAPNWTIWSQPCPAGESLADAAQRARNVIARAEESGGNVALFSHGHMLRILTATWLNQPPSCGRLFMLDTCTISVLSHEHESPTVKVWNAPVDLSSNLQYK